MARCADPTDRGLLIGAGTQSGPASEEVMFSYRLHLMDGSDAGEATFAEVIRPGDEIIAGDSEHFRVYDLVPLEDEGSPFVGLLQVEATEAAPP